MPSFDTIRALLNYEEQTIKELNGRLASSEQWFISKLNEIADIDPESGKTGVALAIAIALSAISEIERSE